jgi:hypothetical protein
MPTTCALCRRRVPVECLDDTEAVQQHHLAPVNRAESPTVDRCRPCHDQVHGLFTEAELRESFDDVASLGEADRLAKSLDWIRPTDTLGIDARTSDRVRRRR